MIASKQISGCLDGIGSLKTDWLGYNALSLFSGCLFHLITFVFPIGSVQAIGQVGELVENHIGVYVAHSFQQAICVKRIGNHGFDAQRGKHFGFGRLRVVPYASCPAASSILHNGKPITLLAHATNIFCAIFVSLYWVERARIMRDVSPRD